MSKMKMMIWGREFELPVIIKRFKGKEITELQSEAVSELEVHRDMIDASLDEVKSYVLKNGLAGSGIDEVENIFKYVIPKSISVPKANNRTIAIMCNYKFDMEHGIAIVFENEKFKQIGPQDIVL